MAASTQESRTYTAHLLAELLATPGLPEDLHQALSEHLLDLYHQVDILKPENCRRLYPLLIELVGSDAPLAVNEEKGHSEEVLTEIDHDL